MTESAAILNPEVERIGRVAAFYIPSDKLHESVRTELHEFFVSKHKAYTHESSDIKGYWMGGGELVRDSHERYEISFEGRDKFDEFVSFLSSICGKIREEAIYLTFGNDSFLVRPKT